MSPITVAGNARASNNFVNRLRTTLLFLPARGMRIRSGRGTVAFKPDQPQPVGGTRGSHARQRHQDRTAVDTRISFPAEFHFADLSNGVNSGCANACRAVYGRAAGPGTHQSI